MSGAMDWYGLAAAALVVLAFFALHRARVFAAAAAVILAAFALKTYRGVTIATAGDWFEIAAGLVSWVMGLLLVRAMLVRSVSLHLLARIGGADDAGSFADDIAARLNDMRAWHLVRAEGDRNALTPFGRAVARLVVLCCRVLGIPT